MTQRNLLFTAAVLILEVLKPIVLSTIAKSECSNRHPFCVIISSTTGASNCSGFPLLEEQCSVSCGLCDESSNDVEFSSSNHLLQLEYILEGRAAKHQRNQPIKSKHMFTLPPVGSRINQLAWFYQLFRKPEAATIENHATTRHSGMKQLLSVVTRIAQSPDQFLDVSHYLVRTLVAHSNLKHIPLNVLSPSLLNLDPPPPTKGFPYNGTHDPGSGLGTGSETDPNSSTIPNTLFSAYERPDALINLSELFKENRGLMDEFIQFIHKEIIMPHQKAARRTLELKHLSKRNANYTGKIMESMKHGVPLPVRQLQTRRLKSADISFILQFSEEWNNNSALRGAWREMYKSRLNIAKSRALDKLLQLNATVPLEKVLKHAAVIEGSFLDFVSNNSNQQQPPANQLLVPVIISTRIRSTLLLGPFIMVQGQAKGRKRDTPITEEFVGDRANEPATHGEPKEPHPDEESGEESESGILEADVLEPAILDPAIGISFVLSPLILSPEALTAQILSPAALSPQILSPTILAPEILSPLVLSPCILSPFGLAPAVLSPYALSPNILCPNLLSPNVLGPNVLSPQILSPTLLSSQVLSPSVLSNKIATPDELYDNILSPLLYEDGTCNYCGGEPREHEG